MRDGRVETPGCVTAQTALHIRAGRKDLVSAGFTQKGQRGLRRDLPSSSSPQHSSSIPKDHERPRAQPLAELLQRHPVVRLRVHPGAGLFHRLPAHGPLPHLPLHLRRGPAGERAGRLGQLAPTPLGQRGSLLHHQRQPVGPHGDRDPALLHDGGDHGQGVAVGPLPLQGHQPGLRGQLLQQLLLPGLHDPGALSVPDPALVSRLLPRAGPAPLGALRRPVGALLAPGSDGERPRGSPRVGRAGLLHAARAQLHRMVRLGDVPLPDLPVRGPGRRHRHLQRADRSGGSDGTGRAGQAGRVAGARVLAGVRGVLAALPPGHVADDHRRPEPVPPQLRHGGSPLLRHQRGAEPVPVPLRGQPHPLQLPQQELPQQPDQHRGDVHPQRGDRGAGGSGDPAPRSQRRRGRRGEATQVK